ncbi:hypothetical protein [Streptomyces sp. NBC_00271]|uniref:hypothetical protein n=1 Tax=Streptomyces sp. NBC_00271 TaxID=2975697 RepID=UPI002E2B3404|nr:hypothetical protein [Streptomyces sp. NBC_00271]
MNPDRDLQISNELALGLNDIMEYLARQAELKKVRDAAETFADRLPWLTTPEREAVVEVYTADRQDVSHEVLLRIADRTVELRGEYEARYQALRARLISAWMIVIAVSVMLTSFVVP